MKLNKTETKLMNMLTTQGGWGSYDGKREFNAARSLVRKGLVTAIPENRRRYLGRLYTIEFSKDPMYTYIAECSIKKESKK